MPIVEVPAGGSSRAARIPAPTRFAEHRQSRITAKASCLGNVTPPSGNVTGDKLGTSAVTFGECHRCHPECHPKPRGRKPAGAGLAQGLENWPGVGEKGAD